MQDLHVRFIFACIEKFLIVINVILSICVRDMSDWQADVSGECHNVLLERRSFSSTSDKSTTAASSTTQVVKDDDEEEDSSDSKKGDCSLSLKTQC